MNDLLHTFHDVLGQHGLVPEEIFADGNLHRCPTEGKPHKRNGAYIAHLDKPATLWWCNWETDDQGTFCAEEKQTLSFAEMSAWQERQQSIRRQREEECTRRHAEAAQQARQEWNAARACDASHPYLRRKGIPALEGIRQSRDGTLLIPVLDAANNLQSLQRIYSDGTKRFLVGGKVSDGRFIIPGQPEKSIAICEGFATGASIHLATDWTVYVAFSANNLAPVAKSVKEQFPASSIIICGDKDETGRKRGGEAARLANAQLVLPHFTSGNGTDFNDLHQIEGLEAVRSQLEAALTKQHGLVALDMSEFLSMQIPDRGYLLSPILPVQGIGILYAPRGVGKTFAALSVAVAVASGGAVFFASGVFYYFLTEQVKALLQGMADAFPGGVLVFDAANRTAVKMIAKTWLKSAKIKDVGAYFAVSDAPKEIGAWDSRLQVSSRGYMLGYSDLKDRSVSGFFRFLAKVGDGMMKMQIVKIRFGGKQ